MKFYNRQKELAVFAEVKREKDRISLDTLKEKAEHFRRVSGAFKDYTVSYLALSLDDMKDR